MRKNEFEQKYLNKMVEVVLFDNNTFKGYLYSTNDYMNKTKLLDVKNWSEIENLVTISFSEQTQEQQKTSTDFAGTE